MTLLNHNKERKFTFYTVLQFSTPTDVINLCRKTWIRKSGHYGGQCKQTERFSVIEKRSDYFLSLDDKFKPRYNVKINKVQEHDPYQTKKEELSGDISKFHQCSDIAYYSWYFFLSAIEFTGYRRIQREWKFGVLLSVRIRMGQDPLFCFSVLTCWNDLGYWTGQYT